MFSQHSVTKKQKEQKDAAFDISIWLLHFVGA